MEQSSSISTTGRRIEIVDYVRGFAILEMILTHFDRFFPPALAKLITYTETAMALFVLVAGFMVGRHYFDGYAKDSWNATLRLWKRAFQILVIQYIIIATVNAPLYLIGYMDIGRGEPLWLFLLKSAAFLNQIGIVHILPTFIPLFLISPFILYLLRGRLEWLVIALSIAMFAVGNFKPHLLDYADPPIFPFLVIQIYFIAGILWGKSARTNETLGPRNLNLWLIANWVMLATTMYLLHGKIVPARFISCHPLNVFGLLYQTPIIMTILLTTMRWWRIIRAAPFYWLIALFGRHALFAFVLHLYFAKGINLLNFYVKVSRSMNITLVLMSVALSALILYLYERQIGRRPAFWARALHTLFR